MSDFLTYYDILGVPKSASQKDIKEALRIAKKPVFFIGGIDLSNLDGILEQGGKNIAMIRGIIESKDIIGNVRKIKDRLIREKIRLFLKINESKDI